MSVIVRRSTRASVCAAASTIITKQAGPVLAPPPPAKKSPQKLKAEKAVTPLHRSKSLLRCYKKVRKAVKFINRLVESRKLLFVEGTKICRPVIGFYQVQTLARCQMHAMNNALGGNHLTLDFIEGMRLTRLKKMKKTNPKQKLPNLGKLMMV